MRHLAHATRPPEGGTPNESCQTNPIYAGSSAGGTPTGAESQALSCQTKPISPIDRSGWGRARSPAEPSLGLLVQTKPICRHGRKWARAGAGASGAVARRIAPNEPNLSPRRWAGPDAPPMLGAIVPNEANLPFDSSGRGRREVGGGVVVVTACTNEPCAKQSWRHPAGVNPARPKGSRPAGIDVGVSGDNEWCEALRIAKGQPQRK